MNLSLSVGNGSGDEQNTATSHQTGKRRSSHRHTPLQIQRLEEFFNKCPHPDEEERRDLSKELGLKPRQVKFWFQNKRTQAKTLSERVDNNALRAENERIQSENSAIREFLKSSVSCPACGGPSNGHVEHKFTMQRLIQENAYLRQQCEKATRLLADYAGKPLRIQKNFLTLGTPSTSSSSSSEYGLSLSLYGDNSNLLPKQGSNKAVMWETAVCAREDLMKLLCADAPLWISPEISAVDHVDHGFFFLPNPETYERIFLKAHHLRKRLTENALVECSKASSVITMPPLQLVDMFLDCDKWVNLFPTIVGKASTVKVLQPGALGSRNGALQLMHEELHMLTPLVPPREFVFLRQCFQPDQTTWVIGDVSFVPLEDIGVPYSSSFWKLPSGCMIQELSNGFSKVTWVEHVEVGHESLIVHMLYRNLVSSRVAYGAQRWVVALERTCERIGSFLSRHIPYEEATSGMMRIPEGRSSLMRLGQRMMKSFCRVISMKSAINGGDISEENININNNNDIGIRVFSRKNFERGEPHGITLTAAVPIWLPLPPNYVFYYLRDVSRRFQWDVLCTENLEQEVVRISTGTHHASNISVIQAYSESDDVAIVQETCVEPMGCILVYAPVDKVALKAVMQGGDSTDLTMLPSGFVVSRDSMGIPIGGSCGASSSGSGGSILTMTLQILVSDNRMDKTSLSMESVAAVNHLMTTTLDKIKFALMKNN
ncbi:hypothetical protein QN277_019418 [Acacia crassicarpa]|uniref:Uncharacterized protein n=1 Tax=Acacia crassicarpa TaxID=499986 RepID=A0AAE1KDC8_9FABA|nr:hypothetical protein QN277_019418 [Acacia crassicarpa]